MNEALKLGLNDVSILKEIFSACMRVKQWRAARNIQEHLLLTILGSKFTKKVRALFQQATEIIQSHVRLESTNELTSELHTCLSPLMNVSSNQGLTEEINMYIDLLACNLECMQQDLV